MSKIRLGDLYSLNNHPYELDLSDVKIAALANMTPPIFVVTEILNSSKEFDSETGKEKFKQVKCIFYSHKSHKFESLWLDIKHVKPIKKQGEEDIILDKNDEINTASKTENAKPISIEDVKTTFLNNQVILKSCDYELGKLKTTFVKTDNKSSQKVNSHLDFLPPVLTVIDVKNNEEKVGFNPKSGNLRKITSKILLKCKWYNPLSGGFSEDFIPLETVEMVKHATNLEMIYDLILNKTFFRNVFENHIELESGITLQHSYIQPIELIFNHYKYKLKYFDFFKTKYDEMDLSEINFDDDVVGINDLIIDKIPEYKTNLQEFTTILDFAFKKNKYYRITYKDQQDRITRRVIHVKEYLAKKVVIADCLLRDGEERHFRLKESSMLKIEILESKYFS
ncbi:hypothetical protein AAGV28_05405 [Flavobacterium sp. FZUC8N2.13]|uniref:WYL domain-containing protein n=1 Tax=Flavobacterium zubiriense TaxID=3138075 RepID=A0ABV4TA21_9FLAO